MSANDTPRFVVEEAHRVPVNDYPGRLAEIPPSRMFVIQP